jgi:hypothetical protein
MESGWEGKEHDCVNLFTHGFLFPHIRPEGPIKDFTQVGIEIGVPQPTDFGLGTKPATRKDLVIWDSPRAVTWDKEWQAIHFPLCIIEWKARRKKSPAPKIDRRDLHWLGEYSRRMPAFVGYAVTVDFTCPDRRVFSCKVVDGDAITDVHRL